MSSVNSSNTVCVFCSADDNISSTLKALGVELGAHLARAGHTLYLGGSWSGLMASVAEGFLLTSEAGYLTKLHVQSSKVGCCSSCTGRHFLLSFNKRRINISNVHYSLFGMHFKAEHLLVVNLFVY